MQNLENTHKEVVTHSHFCEHCGNKVVDDVVLADLHFCCTGCKNVYQILHARGLQEYYELQDQQCNIRDAQPVQYALTDLNFLDDLELTQEYLVATAPRTYRFFLENVHCVACLWLIEKLPEIDSRILSARLDIGTSIATLQIADSASVTQVAELILKFGYRPHPLKAQDSIEELERRETKSLLYRLGVAAACSGNIMLLAVSVYSGTDAATTRNFEWISAGLFLPILFYSAVPFYKTTWGALRNKVISIDLTILVALLGGATFSFWNLFTGNSNVYFDSIGTLIFLMLATRYVLKRAQFSTLATTKLKSLFGHTQVECWDEKQKVFVTKPSEKIQLGDRVLVMPEATIPADGFVVYGTSSLDASVLTGESLPQEIKIGDNVFAGTKNLLMPLQIQITAVASQSRLGGILRQIETLNKEKSYYLTKTDVISQWYVAAVAIIAASFFLIFPLDEAIRRALALTIVTCPCALAVTTPLAFTLSLRQAAKKGILIKGAEVLEKMAAIQNVFLDKTGTLTSGDLRVARWQTLHSEDSDSYASIIYALEKESRHPIAKAICRFLQSSHTVCANNVTQIEEIIGVGVRGKTSDGDEWSISSCKEVRSGGENYFTNIKVCRNQTTVVQILLTDTIRPEAKRILESLRAKGKKLFLLSGDNSAPVHFVAEQLAIAPEAALSSVSPEKKLEIVSRHSHTLMLGDGANDAAALTKADVGIAVQGSVEASLRAADVYLLKPGIQSVYDLLRLSEDTILIIKRNLILSVIYNLFGASMTFAGVIHPLVAALLMPISSFTVFLLTIYQTSWIRKWKHEGGRL